MPLEAYRKLQAFVWCYRKHKVAKFIVLALPCLAACLSVCLSTWKNSRIQELILNYILCHGVLNFVNIFHFRVNRKRLLNACHEHLHVFLIIAEYLRGKQLHLSLSLPGGHRGMAPLILNLEYSVEINDQRHSPPALSPLCPFNWRLSGSQSPYGGFLEESESFAPCRVSNPGLSCQQSVAMPTKLSRLILNTFRRGKYFAQKG